MTTEQAGITAVVAEARGLSAIQKDLGAVEAKAQAGGLTVEMLMALAKEAGRLRSERDKVSSEAERGVREEITNRFKALKFALPKDATVQVTLKREGDKLIIASASIVASGLADAIYATIGDGLLGDAEKVSSIKAITVNADGVSLTAPTATRTPSPNGGGGGTQSRPMTVDGTKYDSGAAAYKAIFSVDKLPYAMNWDACAAKIRNQGGKDSHTVTE
jgi:hypothetical protein